MGCSRRQNSTWGEGECGGVVGEGGHVMTPLQILTRPRAERGRCDFIGSLSVRWAVVFESCFM